MNLSHYLLNIVSRNCVTVNILSKLWQNCWRQCWLIYIAVTFLFLLHHVPFCLFTFWEEKKCNLGFNSWLFVLTKFAYFKEILHTCHLRWPHQNLITSQGIYFHHLNPIALKISCAKFQVSQVIHKQKLRQHEGSLAAFPNANSRFKKATWNEINEKYCRKCSYYFKFPWYHKETLTLQLSLV